MIPLPDAFLETPIAHPALHDVARGRPENSIAAIEAAVAAGYGIEIDIQASSDGDAMVFHDYDLGRLTDASGPVQARRTTELRAIPLTHGSEGIPTLAEVLKCVAGRVPLLIEIKDQDGDMGPNVGTLEAAVAQDIQGYQGPLALMSFNPHAVAALKDLCPNVPRGLTTAAFDADDVPLSRETCTRLRTIPDLDRTGASFISHQASDLANPRVTEIKTQGLPVLCWTIRTPEAAAEALTIAHNITFEGFLP